MTVYVKKKGKFGKTLKKDAIAALLAAATMSGGMVLVLPVYATENYSVGDNAPLAYTGQQLNEDGVVIGPSERGFFIDYWLGGGLSNPSNSVTNFYLDFNALTD